MGECGLYKSNLLYHGSVSQTIATQAAKEHGNIIGIYGHPTEGLNVDTLREAISMMQFIPTGDKESSLVIGPMDILSVDGVEDVLLKTLEEPLPGVARPYLWAYDVATVRKTIRSRCLEVWCPGQPTAPKSLPLVQDLIRAVKDKSIPGILDVLGDNTKWKEIGVDVLQAIPMVLDVKSKSDMRLWSEIRDCMYDDVSFHEVLGRFLP